jgi:arylsulfatase A-like enzyme
LADKRSGGRIFRIGQLIKSIFRRDVYGRAFQLRRAREIDAQVGRILGFLKAEGLYERTLIVTMSDHGDAFGEHGEFSHREYLYDTTLRIPLIIKGPRDLSGKVIPQLVRSIDVYPTILEMLGLRAEGVDGVSLVRLMVGHHRADLHAYSETRHEVSVNELDKLRSHFVSLRTPRWKLILNRLDGTKQLYDLWKDPAERQNVWSQYKGIANYLEKELLGLLSKEDAQGAIQMSPEEIKITEETLKGLGYL